MNPNLHKTKDASPVFPCYLWHADLTCWIYASSANAFLPDWKTSYTYWHEMQRGFPQDPPEAK